MARGFTSNTFVSKTNRGLAVFSAVLVVAVGIAMSLYAYGTRGYIIVAVGITWLLLTIFFSLWRPQLHAGENTLLIVNPLRTVEIDWAAVVHVDTKFALTVFTPAERFRVSCAPQPGQIAARRAMKRIDKEPNARKAISAGIRIGDIPGTESGDAAALVRDRWESWRHRVGDAAPDANEAQPIKRFNFGAIGTMVLMPLALVLIATV